MSAAPARSPDPDGPSRRRGPAAAPHRPVRPSPPHGHDPDAQAGDGGRGLAISNAIVQLLRTRAGRGPTKARAFVSGDLIVVHLRDCLTVGERTIHATGRGGLVVQGRDVLHSAIRAEATAAVEAITGKRVIAYLSAQQADPDHAMIAFMLDKRGGNVE